MRTSVQCNSKLTTNRKTEAYFFAYCRGLVEMLKEIEKVSLARGYKYAINRFWRFCKCEDIRFEDIDQQLMMRYESHLLDSGICRNSTSFYMRNLRAMYNRAVDDGLCVDKNPFKRVYKGVDDTRKRAISIDYIKAIKRLTGLTKNEDFARDIFLFSFSMRGMSFVDIAHLKKENTNNGIITYRRRKTKQLLRIKCEDTIRDIIAKYADECENSSYVFPILQDSLRSEEDKDRRCLSALHTVNSNLDKIGCKIRLQQKLTTYVARHSWASVANNMGISIGTISQAMGHTSEKTTRIYLASVDTSKVDKANHKILSML